MAARTVESNTNSNWNWSGIEEINEQEEPLHDEDVLCLIEEVRQGYDVDNLDQVAVAFDNLSPSEEEDSVSTLQNAVDSMHEPPTTSCTNCSKEIIIEDVSQFKVAQHLSKPGAKRKVSNLYKHHAIVKKVISTYNTVAELELIHFQYVDGKLQIAKTTEKYDLRKDTIYYIKYEHPRYKPEMIVKRAEKILDESNEEESRFKNYNLLSCNCEHFATWCVVGKGESLQVQGYKEQFDKAWTSLFGASSMITRGLTRLAFTSADEIAAGLQGSIGIAAGVVLGATSGVYLLYCIAMTLVHIKAFKDGNMCRSCLKAKLIDLWLGLGVFGITSGLSILFMKFLFPLIGPAVGVPLVILLVLLSVALQTSIPKLRQSLQSHFQAVKKEISSLSEMGGSDIISFYHNRFKQLGVERKLTKHDKKEISSLSEIGVGDIISFRYYGCEHVGVVTELTEHDKKVTCVHYALPTLFGTRIVKEETFDLDPSKQTVRLFDCNLRDIKPSHEVVEFARKRVGETKWSYVNRSDHLCYWAKYKNNAKGHCENEAATDQLTARFKTAFIREEDVHLMNDIELGDVVKYEQKQSKGIVVGIESLDNNYGRTFELKMMEYNISFVFNEKTYLVDLNKDKLTVIIYHPEYCFPMSTRCERAIALTGKKGEWWTIDGFISHCIMRKH